MHSQQQHLAELVRQGTLPLGLVHLQLQHQL
jgi:hypothetical protein